MVADAKLFTAGTGIYTPAEAALYARINTATLNRWLFGNRMGQPVVRPQVSDAGERVVTFLDFVQAMAVRAIRVQHHIHLDKIRSAVEFAEREYGLKYPLARKHTTYLVGRDIQIVPEQGADPIQASGKSAGQIQLRPILELFMLDVGFDADNLAHRFTAFKAEGREIVMDPAVRFGEPLLSSCNYTPHVLAEAVEIEGGIKPAAVAYGVEEADIVAATRYVDHLRGVMAA